jgi:hypothetical protein
MKKVCLVVAFILISAVTVNAGCKAADDCIMWFDAERAVLVVRACMFNEAQGKIMMMQDMSAGVAVGVNKGTQLSEVMPVKNTPMVVVKLNGMVLVTHEAAVTCK